MGKHLHECLGWDGPVTHRQFLTWMHWLNEQWNEPSRDNYYQMQTASMQSSKPGDLGKFKIQFKTEQAEAREKKHPFPPLTKETIAKVRMAVAKAEHLKIVKAAKPSANNPRRSSTP